jgi:hypothetical protein
MLISTLHGGYHLFDDVMLFDLDSDPFEQRNVATERADVAAHGLTLLSHWHAAMIRNAARGRDPLENVVLEGGPYHARGELPAYLERLRSTGRAEMAAALAEKYR